MADFGYGALFLALIASVYAAFAFAISARNGSARLRASARNAVIVVGGLTTIAVGVLLSALLAHDFRLEYVAEYSRRGMSLVYLVSALWAGNAGSLLIWVWVLTILAVVLVVRRRETGRQLVPIAATVMMLTAAFFLILLLGVVNPFRQLAVAPADGNGLNPLLENPGMLFHPITLLAGYVAFTVPFALAVAALLRRPVDGEWVTAARRWTLVAWLLLGIGNIIGAWWAYVELGWGGYWAWDPVENASLMPWLTGTALLHSLSMQRRRGIFKTWSLVLAIVTFDLTIFGTFLSRTGFVTSAVGHAFTNTGLEPYFITFLVLAVVVPLGLVVQRRSDLAGESGGESLVSRESTFLLNNLLLVGSTGVVLLGTLYPALAKAFSGSEVAVSASFFNRVNGPLFLVIVLLAGICGTIGWRKASGRNLARNFLWPAVGAAVVTIVCAVLGVRQIAAVLAVFISSFVVGAIVYEWFRGTRARRRTRGENAARAFASLIASNRPRYGGYIVHIGIAVFALGVVGSSLFAVSQEATLKPGQSMTVSGYTLTYDGLTSQETAARATYTAALSVDKGGKSIGELAPVKFTDISAAQPVTEVAIRSTPVEDLYVILVGWDTDQTAAFKVLVNPLVMWLWIGGGILVFGGVVAFWPARKKAREAAK